MYVVSLGNFKAKKNFIKLHPWKFGEIMYVTSLLKFQGQKPRPLKISHEFFLFSLGYSTLFLINSWKLCMLFLEYHWKFYIQNNLPPPPLCVFFQNGPISKTLCQFKHCPIIITTYYWLPFSVNRFHSMQHLGHNMLHSDLAQHLPSASL